MDSGIRVTRRPAHLRAVVVDALGAAKPASTAPKARNVTGQRVLILFSAESAASNLIPHVSFVVVYAIASEKLAILILKRHSLMMNSLSSNVAL